MAITNSVDIQCGNCGRTDRVCHTTQNVIHVIQKGWNSFGSALYCPDCSKTWHERNKDKELMGKWNTVRLIDEWYDRQHKRRENE